MMYKLQPIILLNGMIWIIYSWNYSVRGRPGFSGLEYGECYEGLHGMEIRYTGNGGGDQDAWFNFHVHLISKSGSVGINSIG